MKKQLSVIIVLLVIFTLVSGMAHGAGRVAILIGVDRYTQEQQISPLQAASSDARKLSQVLSRNGYDCRVMADEDAAKEQVVEAFAFIQVEQQTSQMDELDLFLVYFSGRGTRVPDDIQADEMQDGLDECILPADAVAGSSRSYIRDDALARWISAVHAKQVVLILDCAFWGDDADPGVKGLGALAEAQELDGIGITDDLPQDIVIISAGSPGTRIEDGVFTATFLESLVTEEADGDGDRAISFGEAYQYAHGQLQERQPPKIVGSKAADIPFAPLPPLSRLHVKSEPPQAQVLLYRDSQEIKLSEAYHTPAMIPLTKGTYKVQVQKKGFLIPEAEEAAVTEYNSLYAVDAFKLEPIELLGQVNVTSSAGESIPVPDGLLTIHVNEGDKEVYKTELPSDGRFQFAPAAHDWLVTGSEYEIRVTGRPVLSAEPVPVVYDGHAHINTTVSVTLDDIPPVLAPEGVTLQATHLVAGDKLQGSVHAKDDGLGLTDVIIIRLQPPDEAETVSIPAPDIRFQPPGAYEFSYTIPGAPASAGDWSVAAVTLEDKAGNKADISGDQLNVKFHVFASRSASGRYYFDSGDYAKAIEHLEQVSPPDDDAYYFIALSHHYLEDQTNALVAFRRIVDKSHYLGKARSEYDPTVIGGVPQMPRKMVNRLWGELLDKLDANREDASYMELLAITAEELDKTYEAKIYRSHAERLRKASE